MTEIDPDSCCRICGYFDGHEPWVGDLCPCCGVQHGDEDVRIHSLKAYRRRWIANGSPWFKPEARPGGWNLELQLKRVPPLYRI
jgi:hypothetical protein